MNPFDMTIGQRLLYLKAQSGLSLNAIAEGAGYRGASSIQKLFRVDYNPPTMAAGVLDRLKGALIGKGNPPLREKDFQFDVDPSAEFPFPPADISRLTREITKTITVVSTSPLSSNVFDERGVAVEAFGLGESILKFECPVHLRKHWVWGLVISVLNCSPRYEVGEIIFYKMTPDPKLGEDVMLELKPQTTFVGLLSDSPHKPDYPLVLGRLLKNDHEGVRIEQFSPRSTILLQRDQIEKMYALVSRDDSFQKMAYAID